jgi:uncharacterized protein (UPF0332 family)/predicted nucleotidyltransferase
LILFGSKARGDAHAESDIDVLVELREATPEQRDRVRDFTVDLHLEDEMDLMAIVFDQDELEHQIELGMPLMRNVALDGIPIIGEAIKFTQGKPEQVARQRLESGREHLTSAHILFKAGHFRDIVLFCYETIVDAAEAALVALGIRINKRAGVLALFRHYLIDIGRVDRRYGPLLNQIQKSRLEADYARLEVITEAQVRAAQAAAEDFVAMIEALLPDLLAKGMDEEPDENNGADVEDAAK